MSFWTVPTNTITSPAPSSLWFTDLIRGFVPSVLTSALIDLNIPHSRVTSLLGEWLFELRTVAWKSIWLPRCDEFQDFLRQKGVTPAFRCTSRPLESLSTALTVYRPSAPSTDCLTSTSQAKIRDHFNFGTKFPFRMALSHLVSSCAWRLILVVRG